MFTQTLLSYRVSICTAGLLFSTVCQISSRTADAEEPAAEISQDHRLGPLRTLDSYFPFDPPESLEQWNVRAEALRRQVLVATGLWPMPTETPSRPVVHGQIDRGEYTVEKVYFESFPGFYVTGNLYRPKGRRSPLPGVLCPHGHWPNGRFMDTGPKEIRKQLVAGAERFEFAGRFPIQSRCVQLARMGCVVFHYDMVGYADSTQLPQPLAHGGKRAEDGAEDGFFSTTAQLRLQNIMGLQTYNSIRALDWLIGLGYVDPKRIGVTGASGGGTQTFLLGAVDPRPTVAFPAVMASTAMQGGCTCENASCLRVGAGNVDFSALFAPKPLGLTAADDWTREMATKGFPELKQLYELLGAPNNTMLKPLVHFGHNYNYVSRAAMYSWFNRHLGLGWDDPIVEEDFEPLAQEEMSVWDHTHPRPAGGIEFERRLVGWMSADSDRQIAGLVPTDQASLDAYEDVVGGAFDVIIGRKQPPQGAVEVEKLEEIDRDGYQEAAYRVRNLPYQEEVSAALISPTATDQNGQVVIWLHGHGKGGLSNDDGSLRTEVRSLLDAGFSVVTADLIFQNKLDGQPNQSHETQRIDRDHFAGYTYGYNHSLFAQRVHDILTLVAAIRSVEHPPTAIHFLGEAGAGPWVAAARAQAGDAVGRTVVDTGGFRFAKITSWRDANFLPGAVKYGDLPALMALSAPGPLWLAGEEGAIPPVTAAAYRAIGSANHITSFSGKAERRIEAAVEWLKAE